MTPKRRDEAIRWLSTERNVHQYHIRAQENLDAAITALTNEAALAEQVRVLREALTEVRSHYPADYQIRITEILDAALALPIPDAARQAAENAEKAGLLEWLCQYSESRFSQWMATYKAGIMMGHMTLLDALRAAKEAGNG